MSLIMTYEKLVTDPINGKGASTLTLSNKVIFSRKTTKTNHQTLAFYDNLFYQVWWFKIDITQKYFST